MLTYREKALRLGQATGLAAVLTEPPAGTPPNGQGVVLLNAGLLHRVGPSRLHVQIARRLAPLGFTSMRFDFSGIGDSDARRDGLAFEQSAVLEVQQAIDALAGRGAGRFTLMGLCSGADAAFLTALADPRVQALALLDPWVYHTWKYAPLALWRKLGNRRSWANLLSGNTLQRRVLTPLLRHVRGAPDDDPTSDDVVVAHYARDFPPREQVCQQMQQLVGRSVRMLAIFSGGMPEHVSYRGQLRECFPEVSFGQLLEEHYEPRAEHIFSALHHQRWVVEMVAQWMGDKTAAPAQAQALALRAA